MTPAAPNVDANQDGLYDVVIPAGGSIDDAFASRVGTRSKALIPFGHRTVLARTIDALTGSGHIRRVVLAGTEEVLAHPDAQLAHERVASGSSGPDTILRGVRHLMSLPDAKGKFLIVTADMPFLTPAVIARLLEMCPRDRDVCVPLITQREYTARFPGSDSTFIPLRDQPWTAGCAYVMDVEAFRKAMPDLERLFAVRKSKLGMIRMLGPEFVLKFLTHRLTLADVEKKIVRMLGCTGAAVTGAPPELAYDIDYLDDYEYALTHFSEPHDER